MKKISLICMLMLLLAVPSITHAQPKIGDSIGTVYNTDIVAYINNYAIPSYAANGQSLIVVEDLVNFGFNVRWDSALRTLFITRNSNITPNVMDVEKQGVPGSKLTDLLYTDIIVSANGYTIPSYSINGYTLISLEGLWMFGEINWVESQRAIKLWINDFHVRTEMQPVGVYSEQIQAFRDIAQFLIQYGYYDYDFEDYNLDYEYDESKVFLSYNPENDYIMSLSYEGELETSVLIFPGNEYCYYEILAGESGISGKGSVKMDEIEYLDHLPFVDIESDFTLNDELKQRFVSTAEEAFVTNIYVAGIILNENNAPRKLSELGFVFLQQFGI